ncbi:MAG: cell division protein SepF [Clostridia bacterium]|nr:cell division protein SepF [Clostridia bacterium]
MFDDFMKKVRKRLGVDDESTDIPSFPTYEEVEPMNTEKNSSISSEEVKKPVTPIVANTGDSESNIELKVVHPASFDEVGEIADYLIEGCTVVLNLELLDPVQTVRMLDFLNGVTYSTEGEIKNVAKNTYIITPNNVDISEDD